MYGHFFLMRKASYMPFFTIIFILYDSYIILYIMIIIYHAYESPYCEPIYICLNFSYQFEKMLIHWGSGLSGTTVGGSGGSEHSIGGRFFPGEVQLLGFNSELHSNLSEALGSPSGAVGVALMIREDERGGNRALKRIVQLVKKVCVEKVKKNI